MVAPLFSILHPSARPHKWREIYDAWIKAAVHPENVEYILCADERWGFNLPMFPFGGRERIDQVVRNTARRCYVDSVNIAAKASIGRIIIVIADDQYPCEEWDDRLMSVFARNHVAEADLKFELVLEVSTGTPNEHQRGMIVMPVLSRARYERLGYVFYPEYESMYADNDFYEHAKQDGCIIDARHLMFPHRHPSVKWNGACNALAHGDWDDAYVAQNRTEAYVLGEAVLRGRRQNKFTIGLWGASAPQTPASPGDGARPVSGYGPNGAAGDPLTAPSRAMKQRPSIRGSIALALPGENFSGLWVAQLMKITIHLLEQVWNFCPVISYTSSAGITRHTIWRQIELMAPGFVPDYILWIDDDQVVDPGIVDLLIADMEALPDADVVAGWTWIAGSGAYFNDPQVSCGRMDLDKGELSHAWYQSVQAAANGDVANVGTVFEVQWTGFPVLLMRPSAMKKAGKHPFAHFPCPESPWGECGEDISFCKRLQDAGGKIYVEARAFVPHLKQKPLGPSPESKDEIALALSGRSAPSPYPFPFTHLPSVFVPRDKGMGPLNPLEESRMLDRMTDKVLRDLSAP